MKKLVKMFVIFIVFFAMYPVAKAQEKADKVDMALDQSGTYLWYKGDRPMEVYLALDEVAIFQDSSRKLTAAEIETMLQDNSPQARITKANDFVIYLTIPSEGNKTRLTEKLSLFKEELGSRAGSPVFYPGPRKNSESRMALTGEIIIHFASDWDKKTITSWANVRGLTIIKNFSFSPQTYLISGPEGLESLNLANEIYLSGEVVYAYPNWLKTMPTRAIPDDTLFNDQWHLRNTGQGGGTVGEDVNIVNVWDTYRGTTDEVIAIVDDGLEIAHEDLSPNVLAGYSWDYVGGDADPTGGRHGTCVGGVAAARGFNTQGVCGAAPWAALVGHRLLGAGTDTNEADALTRNNQILDIYSNSWGPSDDGARLEGPGPLTEAALLEGITNGREGLGSIYVWAGGNGYDADNSNYDGYANSRYTIAVAASTNYGDRSYYSEAGANILVNTPSNGGSLGIMTTDRSEPGQGYAPSSAYYDNFGGTSSSAPLAAGIIALMLEANPNLTWRDAQIILAVTAEKNDPTDSDWATNGAGYPINHKYGFGRVDALAAVAAAETWTNVGPEVSVEDSSNPNLPIPDNDPVGVSDTIIISDNLSVEYVEIYFSAADHTYWGDLQVELISPDGTVSILAEGQHSVSTSYAYDNWRFGSARHLGESSQGTWTLSVKDIWSGDTGTFQSWTLKIYGEDKSAYVVNMTEMPWHENIASYYSTGAAVCQMILNYIREGAGEPLLTQDEIYEYGRDPLPYDGTELNADQVDKTLGHFDPYDYLVSNSYDIYDSLSDGNPYQGYNYSVDTYTVSSLNEYMRDICHWMDYEVTQESWWWGGDLVARPNTPAAVPIFGDTQGYNHWVAVKGFAASADPCPEPQTDPWNTPDFTVYGFWMKDPQVSGIGMNTYKTAAECEATYFKALSTSDAYNGKFLQVAEPPAEMSNAYVQIQEPSPNLANLEFAGIDVGAETTSRYSPASSSGYGKEPLLEKKSWRDLVDPRLLSDPEVLDAFEDTRMGASVLVRSLDKGRDYYLVPFRKQDKQAWRNYWRNFTATGVIILDAQEGYFREATWTKDPQVFLPVNKFYALWLIEKYLWYKGNARLIHYVRNSRDTAELVWEAGGYSPSPYQPYWMVNINGITWYVTQNGEIPDAEKALNALVESLGQKPHSRFRRK